MNNKKRDEDYALGSLKVYFCGLLQKRYQNVKARNAIGYVCRDIYVTIPQNVVS